MGHTTSEHEEIMRQRGESPLNVAHRGTTLEIPVETHRGREWRAVVHCSCGQWESEEVELADLYQAEEAFRAHRDGTDGRDTWRAAYRRARQLIDRHRAVVCRGGAIGRFDSMAFDVVLSRFSEAEFRCPSLHPVPMVRFWAHFKGRLDKGQVLAKTAYRWFPRPYGRLP